MIVVQMARHEDSSKLYNLKGPSLARNLRLKVVAVVDFPKRQATLGTTLSQVASSAVAVRASLFQTRRNTIEKSFSRSDPGTLSSPAYPKVTCLLCRASRPQLTEHSDSASTALLLTVRPIYTGFVCLLPLRTTTTMASDAAHLDDVSPEDFVRRVRELQLERDRQDRERAADLEREILQSREQRRVRRAGE